MVYYSLAVTEYYKAIGLSANKCIVNATIGSLEELFQSFSDDWTKQHFESKDHFDKFSKNIFDDGLDIYKDYYFKISPDDFYKEYEFLIKNSPKQNINNSRSYDTAFKNIVKVISEELSLEVFCCFIPCTLNHLKTKIVKVYSPDGYPHMLPKYFTEEETKIKFNHDTVLFPNQYRQIPFP
ncbi:hypothetical protein GCM10028868_35310 [Virgibacillus kimchii]